MHVTYRVRYEKNNAIGKAFLTTTKKILQRNYLGFDTKISLNFN